MVCTTTKEFTVLRDEELSVSLDAETGLLQIDFEPKTDTLLYDICDLDGRVMQTGKFTPDEGIPIDTVKTGDVFMVWIVDGDRSLSARFDLARQRRS